MKIAILTMPLLDSYGGILQNYALQLILKKLKINSITLDIPFPSVPFWRFICSTIKTIAYRCVGKKRVFVKRKKNTRNSSFFDFVHQHIETVFFKNYDNIRVAGFDSIIVGSDQVWRPKYNYRIEDMFLKFAEKLSIKRIAYAASFGVDNWEYTPKQTFECAALAKKFDAISVREESGINLCKQHLGVDATWVLDPTLLLDKEDYCEISKDIPAVKEKILAAYILDKNDTVRTQCESIAAEQGLSLKFFEAGTNATLSVPEWLAMFRDASYVVTDSFHGTVFSIIFGKEFKCLYNKSRGSARFDSLLKLYESGKLDEMREYSLNWLKNALEK